MYQYSFANVDLILEIPDSTGVYQSITVRGFATGENLINIQRRAPIATTQFGAYGDMVVSMQRIKAGDLTFPVLMNAPENKLLQDYCNYFQEQADADGSLVFPIQAALKDNMGKDEARLDNGVILAIPAITRGQTMNTVTWILTFENIDIKRNVGEDATQFGVQL
jgi:hypothetical protein